MNNIIIWYLLHADDLVLLSETPEGLQELIDGLHEFCKHWHIFVNLIKTNVCVFNTLRPRQMAAIFQTTFSN